MKVKLFLTSLLLIFSLSITGCVTLSTYMTMEVYRGLKEDQHRIDGLYVSREQFIEEYIPRCVEELQKLAEEYNFTFEEYTDPKEVILSDKLYEEFSLYFYSEEFAVQLLFTYDEGDERYQFPAKIVLKANLYYWYTNKIDKLPDDLIKYETIEKVVNFLNDFCNTIGDDAITDHNIFETIYYEAYMMEDNNFDVINRWINDSGTAYLVYRSSLYSHTKGFKNKLSTLDEPHYYALFRFYGNVKPLEDFGLEKSD